MTRGDFAFVWHYRERAGEIVVKVLKNAGYTTKHNPPTVKFVLSMIAKPMGLQIALNSMDPESYEYVQNVHGYTVREPRQSF